MKDNLILEGKNYISARRAALIINYAQDYVGQLCRAGKLDCRMVGRSWFVTEESLLAHRAAAIEPKSTEIMKVVEEKIEEKKIEVVAVEEAKEAVSEFKYEAEKAPLLPALGKKVPLDFAIPKNASSIVFPSFHFDARRAYAANAVFMTLFVASLGMSALIYSSSLNVPSSANSQASVASATRDIVDTVMGKITGISSRFASQFVASKDSPTEPEKLNGLGIVPSTSPEADEMEKERIRNSFSDEVIINTDMSGTAGVITPVFRKTNGDDFVYVLVPVKEKKK